MAGKEHPHYAAAKMAAAEMNDLMGFIKGGEFGMFPDAGPSAKTARRRRLIDDAPEDIRSLLDNGYPLHFVERLAREVKNA